MGTCPDYYPSSHRRLALLPTLPSAVWSECQRRRRLFSLPWSWLAVLVHSLSSWNKLQLLVAWSDDGLTLTSINPCMWWPWIKEPNSEKRNLFPGAWVSRNTVLVGVTIGRYSVLEYGVPTHLWQGIVRCVPTPLACVVTRFFGKPRLTLALPWTARNLRMWKSGPDDGISGSQRCHDRNIGEED